MRAWPRTARWRPAEWVVDQAVQLHGGTGYLRESEVERHYRDVRILGIGGGATEVLADLAGRLLGYASVRPPGLPDDGGPLDAGSRVGDVRRQPRGDARGAGRPRRRAREGAGRRRGEVGRPAPDARQAAARGSGSSC